MKLNLTSQELLDKQFKLAPRGYDALEVDEFLDRIINDYQLIEQNVIASKDNIDSYKEKIKALEKEIDDLKVTIKRYETRLEGIKNNPNATIDNADLLKRISALEKFIYHIGYNPNTIK